MVYHRVRSGDTLSKIARMYGTSVSELCRLNGLKSTSTLRIGQSIRCSAGVEPSSTKKATTAKSKQPAKTTTNKTITVKADASAAAALPQATTAAADESAPIYHRIKSGDTLGTIARRYGTTVQKLCELNGITKTTVLRLGRTLRCS